MKCTKASWIIVWVLMVIWPSLLFGAIPQSINYQGRLTNSVGAPLDTTVTLEFTIYKDSLGTLDIWSETHPGTVIQNGLFQVLLGSNTHFSASVFDGSKRWLGVQLQSGPAPTALIPIVSTAYAYRSAKADTADYAKNAGGGDCADCNTIFVNVIGPDSVYATSGTAFLGKTVGNSSANIIGINGYGANAGNSFAYGGYFSTSGVGTSVHAGVKGEGLGASDADVYGVQGRGDNTSTGDAYGGYFTSTTNGTGVHYGLYSKGFGNSSSGAYGIDASASNGSSGTVYGGAFTALTGGTGTHYGVHVNSEGSAAATNFGVWSEAENTSTGYAYGGHFRTTTGGTGKHYGVSGNANGASDADAYASYGYATNTSTGDAYGGYFITSSAGTGVHYGVRTDASGASSSAVFGISSEASNSSTGSAYGGTFSATSAGDGSHYGVYSLSYGSSSNSTYAVYGSGSNTSSGRTYGGYFTAASSGTGEHTGVYAEAINNDATPCFGVYGYANNTSSGDAFGGYFYGSSGGTGAGIYAESGGASDYAGWFQGRLGVTDDLWVGGNSYIVGSKSAAVTVDNGEYRALYCQESPENWFEDFGEGQLTSGKAHIELDAIFLQTVTIDKDQPIKVFIQLNDENCNGTAVKRGATGFDVIELQKGTSNAAFSYRVVAKRKNYENKRLDVIPGPALEEMKANSAKIQAKFEADRVATQAENERVSKEREASKRNPATEEEK